LRVKTQYCTFPFIQKSATSSDDKIIIFAADNGFKRIVKEKIPYSKLHLFGDFDSLSDSHLKKAHKDNKIVVDVLPKQKNMSDFGAILDHIFTSLSTEHPFFIEIYGGLGNAHDHEYANIKEAEYFLSQSKHGGIIVFQNSLVLSTISFALDRVRKKPFTIFCSNLLEFKIQNALYSGQVTLSRPSHGLSNLIEKSPLIIDRPNSSEIMTLIMRNKNS